MPTGGGAAGSTLPFDAAFVTGLDKTLHTGIVMFLLMTSATKFDTVFGMTLALTSDAVVVPWLDMASGMSTGKKLRLRTVMAFATMPDMTPMNPLITITVTTLAPAAATATTTGVKLPPEPP